ncbi:MAG: hypothetical protein JNK64_15705 [Myxococcales bacterium]|nr:hypothetical protein [Myxococcales bacterium]
MKRLSMIMLMAAAIAVAGCKKKSQPKPAPTAGTGTPAAGTGTPAAMSDAELEAQMAEYLTMMVALGKALDDAGGDCGKTSAGMNAVLDKYAAALARGKALTQDPATKGRIEAWGQKHMSEVMALSMKVASAGQKCGSDPAFQQTIARLSP